MTFVRLPKKRPKKARRTESLRCPGHLSFLRQHECSIAGRSSGKRQWGNAVVEYGHVCQGRIEAHHVTTRGAGGGDDTAVPLCSGAHADLHNIGIETFEKRYAVDLAQIAEGLARISPALKRYHLKQRA